MKAVRTRLTYANVISTLCLFLVLGGGAYAATQLPKNSVGTKQIKDGAITGKKIKRSTIGTDRLTAAAVAALKGATGERGPAGTAGTPASKGFYATVLRTEPPAFTGAHPGFTAVSRPPGPGGVYCLVPAAGVDYAHPIASSDWQDSSGQGFFIEALAREEVSNCEDNSLEVRTYKATGEAEAVPTDEASFTVFLAGN
jgi:hypothetical protein